MLRRTLLSALTLAPLVGRKLEPWTTLSLELFLNPYSFRVSDAGIAAWLASGPLLRTEMPHFTVVAPGGDVSCQGWLVVNDSLQAGVADVAALPDGGAAVVGHAAAGAEGVVRGFGVFDRSGRMERFVRTNPFQPRHATLGGDGHLWLFGSVGEDEPPDRPDDPRNELLRIYKFNGEVYYHTLYRDLFPPGLPPDQYNGKGGLTRLVAFEGGVGIWSGVISEWIEVRREGVKRRLALKGFYLRNLATVSGRVFADGAWEGEQDGLHELDFETGRWTLLPGWESGPNTPSLFGTFNNQLVVRTASSPRQLWLTQP